VFVDAVQAAFEGGGTEAVAGGKEAGILRKVRER